MDLTKVRVPSGTVRVEIDDPPDYLIAQPSGAIRGWFATFDYGIPEDYQFRVGPLILRHTVIKRPDVEGAMPGHNISGFKILYDLADYLLYITDNRLVIELTIPDYQTLSLRFAIKEGALASCISAAGEL